MGARRAPYAIAVTLSLVFSLLCLFSGRAGAQQNAANNTLLVCTACHIPKDGKLDSIESVRMTPEGWRMTLERKRETNFPSGQRRPRSANKSREVPFHELVGILFDRVIAELTQELTFRKVANVNCGQMHQFREVRLANAYNLILPRKAHAELYKIWTQPADVVDRLLPQFLAIVTSTKWSRRV